MGLSGTNTEESQTGPMLDSRQATFKSSSSTIMVPFIGTVLSVETISITDM